MAFLETLKASIYNPEFYKKTLPGWSFGTSLAYYLTLTALVSLLIMASSAFWILPFANDVLERLAAEALESYPKELVITYKGGEFSANVPQPYAIPVATSTPRIEGESLPTNLLVIDTVGNPGPEKFDEYDTIALITKNDLYVKGEPGAEQVELSWASDAVVDRATVGQWVYRAKSFSGFLAPVLLFGVFLVSYVAQLFSLLGFLFYGAIVWLFVYVTGVKISFGKAFATAIHLATLPILVSTLFAIFIPTFGWPYLFESLFFFVMILNLRYGNR